MNQGHSKAIMTELTCNEAATAAYRASLYVKSLALTNYRNYASLHLNSDARPAVLLGPNGAGKTNLMEAISLLAPGRGLRRATYSDLPRSGGPSDWAVSATLNVDDQDIQIGTGVQPGGDAQARSGRIVRINGVTQSGSGALADYVEMVWLTPALDGLFTGPAAERRRFLDRLILCFDAGYRTRSGHFERAMRQRNRLLEHSTQAPLLGGLETIMAETGVAIAAARVEAIAALRSEMHLRRGREAGACFPWADLRLEGDLEIALTHRPAVDVEDWYCRELAQGRDRDRAAGRTLMGPHRSDLIVGHGPKDILAKLCSTGEQKALLISLILAHAELSSARHGIAPILLLDEIAAHLDAVRRAALFNDILRIGAQAWMTGTDRAAFSALDGKAQFFRIEEGNAKRI